MALRDAILAADDLPREPVDVPWDLDGAKLYARALSFSDYQRFITDGDVHIDGSIMAELVCRAIVDEDGERVFTDADVEALADKNATVIVSLFTQIMRLSGLNEAGQTEVEEHFGVARSGAPSTG